MKLLVQRINEAHVEVDGNIVGRSGPGLLVFVGITQSDTPSQAIWLADKLVNLRIFKDDQGKMNRSLIDQKGQALIISQFTLYADCKTGRRPSFSQAAPPEKAEPLYAHFVELVRRSGISVETGIFGAEMKVFLINDGPVTLILEQ